MLHTSTLSKTAKGLEEIEKRSHKLAGRLRAVLIMIDGHRSVGEVLEQAGALAPQLEAQLEELVAQGFVEPVGENSTAANADPPKVNVAARPRPDLASRLAQPVSPQPVPSIPPSQEAPAGGGEEPAMLYATPLREALVTSELPAIDGVPAMKEKLRRQIADTLGMKGMLMQAQLQACHSRSDIVRLIDDIAREVALTNGSKQGEKWREKSRKLVDLDHR